MSPLMEEIDAVQTDMILMENMLDALIAGAYNEIRPESIGNSLEILKEYLAVRSGRLETIRLETISRYFRMMGIGKDGMTGESFSDKCSEWEEFTMDNSRMDLRSEEVDAAYGYFYPYLEELPADRQENLCLAVRDIGAAFRKQGFIEGLTAAAGMICGEGLEDGQGAV